jgi:hypothetical protein
MIAISRTTIGLTAAGLALTGVAAVPLLGSSASAQGTTHTLKLVAHQSGTHNLGKTSFAGSDVDRSAKTGKIVGYDAITGKFDPSTGKVRIDASLAIKGGLITARLKGSGSSNALDGVITGGTGKYAAIKGTIHTTGNKVTHITLTYTL